MIKFKIMLVIYCIDIPMNLILMNEAVVIISYSSTVNDYEISSYLAKLLEKRKEKENKNENVDKNEYNVTNEENKKQLDDNTDTDIDTDGDINRDTDEDTDIYNDNQTNAENVK